MEPQDPHCNPRIHTVKMHTGISGPHYGISKSTFKSQGPLESQYLNHNPRIHTAVSGSTLKLQEPYLDSMIYDNPKAGTLESQNPN